MIEEKEFKIDSLLMRDLEHAAMNLEKRNYFLARALTKYIGINKLNAISFIRFSPIFSTNYIALHIGSEKDTIKQLLDPLIEPTLDKTIENISVAKFPEHLGTVKIKTYEHGIIISWLQQPNVPSEQLEHLLIEGLQAVSFVEIKEHEYFYDIGAPFEPDVARSIKEKDRDGLVELLALTKWMTNSDITFWGEANSKQIEVDIHIGSRKEDFGFLLPLGKGIGGNAAQHKVVMQVADYKNCAYRYKDVSKAVDSEEIRTIFALPIKDRDQNTSGVLYVGNRKINPLPMNKKFLLMRLANQLEPLVKRKEIKQFYTTQDRKLYFRQKKKELREITQTAKQLGEIEKWLADLLKGDVLLLDADGKPYCQNEHDIERRNTSQFYYYPLNYNERNLGSLNIWTNIELPFENDWPDLIDDVIHAIYIIYERTERFYHLMELERSQWLYNMTQETFNFETQYKKGVKLRVPLDHGEVWAVYWNKQSDRLTLHEKMQLDELSLLYLRQPIFFNGNTGYIMFDRPEKCTPEELRNKFLSVLPVETWIIHGATYKSFEHLHHTLLHLQALMEKVIREKGSEYVLTFNRFGLDHLLSNPRVSKDIQEFSKRMLKPLLEYDKNNNSDLTKTLALSLMYNSPSKVAKKLFIHTNTVHYRINRAKQLLNVDEQDPSSDIALRLAAYAWLFEQKINIHN